MEVTLTLTPEIERFVNDALKRGQFRTPEEALLDALGWIKEKERSDQQVQDDLRNNVQYGIGQLDRGEGVIWDDAFAQGIRDRGSKRLALMKRLEEKEAGRAKG